MAGPELLLDSSIRVWVVLPIVFVTFFVGVIRHYVTQLLHSDKKVDLQQVSDRGLGHEPSCVQPEGLACLLPTDPPVFSLRTAKVPFPLTLRFKPMLQRGIELLSLDASWVSSASWYFLNVFGLRSMYNLILGHDNAADQSRIMQDHMTGAAMAMPPDPNKAFKSEWEALEIVEHQWALETVEEELMSRDLNFGGFFSREVKTTMF
uniref:ER membrane protein complex subunit 3 n=1 Tax=Lepisosteus oculatus TaxID=7918 RepID=W5NBB8_LEPOC